MGYIFIVISIFLGELCIKNIIERMPKEKLPKMILGNQVKIERYYNKGAFLNFGDKKTALVTFVSGGMVLCMLGAFFITLFRRGHKLLKVSLAFLLGGGLSNTYDRLKRKYVVDYFSFPKKGRLSRVVFNLADFFVIIGAVLLMIAKKK